MEQGIIESAGVVAAPAHEPVTVRELDRDACACSPPGQFLAFDIQTSSYTAQHESQNPVTSFGRHDAHLCAGLVTIDADAERSQCCGGFYEQGDVVLPASERPDVCASLDADDCVSGVCTDAQCQALAEMNERLDPVFGYRY